MFWFMTWPKPGSTPGLVSLPQYKQVFLQKEDNDIIMADKTIE